ncbi:gustatory receptor for bitter taste 22e-like [Stomoxys calcitrans]|uniref:gustatory receptor for bitter taste 22e-like n=1 Tax=Stomoxys calcitrans TaxID=35570 RepID=UPI0027E278E8|nr:gustatory receptor for bitter taste 22e-like [Stomoxys calcitrans]
MSRVALLWFGFLTYFNFYTCCTILRIDLTKRRLKNPNRFIKAVVYFGNILPLVSMPYSLALNFEHTQLYVANPLALSAHNVNAVMRFLVVTVVIVTIRNRDARLTKWLEKAMEIQVQYFDRFSQVPKDISHRKWLYLNSIISVIHNIITAISAYNESKKNIHALDGADLDGLFCMVTCQHMYMLHHAALLCYMRECLSTLHNQLRIGQFDADLSFIYYNIRKLLHELNGIYNPVLLVIHLCLIISNSLVGYVVLLTMMIPELSSGLFLYLFGGKVYLLFLVHMYIYYELCDSVEKMVKETDDILKEISTPNTNSEYDKPLERQLDMIALTKSLYERGVNVCGLFNTNLSFLFAVFAQTVMYIIVLIQIDYANL